MGKYHISFPVESRFILRGKYFMQDYITLKEYTTVLNTRWHTMKTVMEALEMADFLKFTISVFSLPSNTLKILT